MALPFIYCELKKAINSFAFMYPGGSTVQLSEAELPAGIIIPPKTTDIPFLTFVQDLPLPYAPGAELSFATCHLLTMASESFLTSGTWCGYILICGHTRVTRFLYPMSAIKFHTHADPQLPNIIHFTTTGKISTSVAAFSWSGCTDSKTGKLDLNARTDNENDMIPQVWQAVMTAFGVGGSVAGQGLSKGFEFWVWLWKEEWTANKSYDAQWIEMAFTLSRRTGMKTPHVSKFLMLLHSSSDFRNLGCWHRNA